VAKSLCLGNGDKHLIWTSDRLFLSIDTLVLDTKCLVEFSKYAETLDKFQEL
jgi:hypothetical protein